MRAQQQRNILATLILSQGTPMIAHGDEMGRTQQGNNNVYCQDDELAWVDWELAAQPENVDLSAFTATVVALRAEHPVFRRRRFFEGRPVTEGTKRLDIAWLTPAGKQMTEADWDSGFGKSIAVFLNGEGIPDKDARGERVVDDSFLLLFNAHFEDLEFTTIDGRYASRWEVVLDTTIPTGEWETEDRDLKAGTEITVGARSLMVLRRTA